MSIEAGLFNLMRTTSAIAEIVENRIYPMRVPEDGEAPCIVYSRPSTEFTDGLDDDEQTGPDTARFRIECWGEAESATGGYEIAVNLADAVLSLWRSHAGLMGTNSTLRCKNSVVEDARDEETQLDDASDYHRYLRVVDIAVEYDPEQV